MRELTLSELELISGAKRAGSTGSNTLDTMM